MSILFNFVLDPFDFLLDHDCCSNVFFWTKVALVEKLFYYTHLLMEILLQRVVT